MSCTVHVHVAIVVTRRCGWLRVISTCNQIKTAEFLMNLSDLGLIEVMINCNVIVMNK